MQWQTSGYGISGSKNEMMLILERFNYAPDCTQGILYKAVQTGTSFQVRELCYTIERPWLNNQPATAGQPGTGSCVPEGSYVLEPYTRPSGQAAFIISGDKHVCKFPDEISAKRPRCLILMHAGNTADDVCGCIAPGLEYAPGRVNRSRDAMAALAAILKTRTPLTIKQWLFT